MTTLARILGLLLAATFVVMGGCTSTPAPLGAQCDRNTDCQTPYVCRLARCRTECVTQRDCPIGSLCIEDSDGFGSCRLPDEESCARDSDCPEDIVCLGAQCTEACTSNRDCALGAICTGDEGSRWCENPTGGACADSSDCPEGQRCNLGTGRCGPVCQANRDCDFGESCVGGICVRPTFDGGVPEDGGPMDGGLEDGGSEDGGEGDGGPDGCTPADCVADNVASADCVSGSCAIVACATGFDDCDDDFATGCELDVSADPLNCGVCAGRCGTGGVCMAGVCDTIVDVGVGADHLCVVRSSGTVHCAGANDWGQLGNGTTMGSSTFPAAFGAPATDLVDATAVEAGNGTSCAVRSTGEAVCFGSSASGQVGHDSTSTATIPTVVMGLTGVEQIDTGGTTGSPPAGASCARLTGGSVACWGRSPVRGDGMTGDTLVPVMVSGLTDAVDITVGNRHACAVRSTGAVECWGDMGPWLGAAGATDLLVPTAVPGITDAVQIDADASHTCAVRSTGQVLCWGDHGSFTLGTDIAPATESADPVAVDGITDAIAVEVGRFHSCALRTGGVVSCWGQRLVRGLLGDGMQNDVAIAPVDVMNLSGATALSVGSHGACAIRPSGALACWGNTGSQLGASVFPPSGHWRVATDHFFFPPTPTP